MSYIVCVCGGSGSGKSTFTGKLLQELGDSAAFIAHDDYYKHYGVENLAIDALWVGAGDGSRPIEMFEEPLKGWGTKVSYHERLKESYYYVQEMWTADDPVAAADAMVSRQLEAEEKAGQR